MQALIKRLGCAREQGDSIDVWCSGDAAMYYSWHIKCSSFKLKNGGGAMMQHKAKAN